MNFVEELRWRGMLHDMMPGTEELLNKEQVTAYIGFDPTADFAAYRPPVQCDDTPPLSALRPQAYGPYRWRHRHDW